MRYISSQGLAKSVGRKSYQKQGKVTVTKISTGEVVKEFNPIKTRGKGKK